MKTNKTYTIFDERQIEIAEQTLKMPSAMAGIMGGITREEALAILKRFNYTNDEIKQLTGQVTG